MYSNVDIEAALKDGSLVIDPFTPEQVKAAGITLHLGAMLLKPIAGTVCDVKRELAQHKARLANLEENINTIMEIMVSRQGPVERLN